MGVEKKKRDLRDLAFSLSLSYLYAIRVHWLIMTKNKQTK